MEKTFWQWMIEPFRVYRTVLFPGRARRKEFWWFVLLQLLVYVPMYILVFLALPKQPDAVPTMPHPAFWLLYLVTLVLTLPSLSVSVRRMHDTNRSGWWLLLPSAATVSALIIGIAVFGGAPAATAAEPNRAAIVFFVCAGVVIFASYIILLVWLCKRGTIGDNRFGPDPLADPGE